MAGVQGETFIGIDVGTGSARAGIFDKGGKLLATAKQAIKLWHEPGDIVEQSSEDIWQACATAVRTAMGEAGLKPADPLAITDPLNPAKPKPLSGSVVFFADRLAGSGIDMLTLSMGQVTGDAIGSPVQSEPGKLIFSGNVSLGGIHQLFLDATQIALIDPTAPASGGTSTGSGTGTILRLHDVAEARRFLTVLDVLRSDEPVDPELRLADELRWAAGRPDGTKAT